MATLSPGTRQPTPDTVLADAFLTLAWRWGENTERSKGSILLSKEEIMEEKKGLLRRSRWRLVGRIHPSSETRWIKFEWWKFSEGFEGERKDEERRAEWSVGN